MPKTADGTPYDPFAIDGADHWYSVGAQRVRALSNDLANTAFRPGYLRAVSPAWTNWAVESFMDDTVAVVDHLGCDGVALLGLGGPVGVLFAAAHWLWVISREARN